jgi:hypothetical protein
MFDAFLDTPIRGVRNLATAAGVVNEDGSPDVRAMYHGLEQGYYDASKRGRTWESTRRRLLSLHLGHLKQNTAT